MANTYRAVTPDGEATFGEGVFEQEFTVAEEQDWLKSGMVELVPRRYRVLSANYAQSAQGDEFDAAMLIEHEASLIAAGHIERVDDEPDEKASDDEAEPPKPRKASTAKKSSSAKKE